MTITPQQKSVINCVLAIFETGRLPTAASYATCTILKDGAGISYGKHQATDKSGSLDAVCQRYIKLQGQYATELNSYLPKLRQNETTTLNPTPPYPEWLEELMNLLKVAGADPLMQQAQDEVFDESYWKPAVKMAGEIGLETALGCLTIYDTSIHSGIGNVSKIRKLFPEASPANGGDEKVWTQAYIQARRNWLQNYKNPIVRNTVYRMDALQQIADEDNWDLETPMTVRNITIP